MSDVVPFRQPPRRSDTSSFLGMVIFLGTWVMLFAALFFAYAEVRLRAVSWPPAGDPHLPVLLPAVNTILLLCSSVTLQGGLAAVRGARSRQLTRWLSLTLALGAIFVALQLYVWSRVWQAGLRPDSSIYGSVFYALTCFHALHVLVGLMGLALLLPASVRGQFNVQRHTPVRLWAMYWHFVDAIWIVMFVTVYLI